MNQLVEIGAIRDLIKRTFPNRIKTIIEELLQNAQRGGANEIRIDTTDTTVSITDNGSGIEDFKALVILGKSNYSEKVLQEQHPMGIGFNSLLAHHNVTSVAVHSGKKYLRLDTQKWWSDLEYAENWQEQLVDVIHCTGTRVTIVAKPVFIADFIEAFDPAEKPYYLMPKITAGRGYSSIGVQIWLNGSPIDNSYPDWIEDKKLLFETSYQNNILKVYVNKRKYEKNFHLINWYGQLVEIETEYPFSFLYEVTSGRPIDLKAPVRSDVIRNQRFLEFIRFINYSIAEYFQGLKELPTVVEVESYRELKLDNQELPNCDYFVAQQIIGYDEENNEAVVVKGDCKVLRYNCSEKVIDPYVWISDDSTSESEPEWTPYYGVESFVSLVEEPLYVATSSQPDVLLEARLYRVCWQPGAEITTNCSISPLKFRQAGEYAIAKSIDEAAWQPVTKNVYAVYEESCSCLYDTQEKILGCVDLNSPATALKEYYLAGYNHCDRDYSNEFKEDTDICLQELQPNTLRENPNKYDLKEFISKQNNHLPHEFITNLAIKFDDKADKAIVTATILTAEDKPVDVIYRNIELVKYL